MATTNDFASDPQFMYFNFHIVATFAEYLNDVEQHCYEKLTDNWWKNCFNEFNPIIFNEGENDEETQSKLFTKVMSEFSKDLLTEAQKKELNTQLGDAIYAFKERFSIKCVCGIDCCDGDCGVQPCGMCIDVCRCYKYW